MTRQSMAADDQNQNEEGERDGGGGGGDKNKLVTGKLTTVLSK